MKNYTLKECRVFNAERHDYCQQFIRGNYTPKAEIPIISLPDDVHPWNMLHSVIEQFYKREFQMAQIVNFAMCETERAQKIIEHSQGSQDTYFKMQKEITDLTKEKERLKAEFILLEKSCKTQHRALQELTDRYGIDELTDNMGGILDGLIMAFEYSSCDRIVEWMKYARALQSFFMYLKEEMGA